MHQPLVKIDGVVRFKENKLVRHLLTEASAGRKCDMNDLSKVYFPPEDRIQFAELIGYSVSGFGELSYVPRGLALRMDRKALRMAK